MKRLIYGGLFLALIGITSCKKDEIGSSPTASSQTNSARSTGALYATDGKILIFKTPDYEKLLIELTADNEQELINNILGLPFTSYTEELKRLGDKAEDLIDDNLLSAILNQDMAVQIGNYFYRVNTKTEKVFVLHTKYSSEYNDLIAENGRNPKIQVFSTDDDVIELVEKGESGGEKGIFCSDRKAKAKSQTSNTVTILTSPKVEMVITASYNRYGVFFSLIAEGEYTISNSALKYYFQVDNSSWAQRCGGSTEDNYSHPWLTKSSGTFGPPVKEKYRHYARVKQLKNYRFKVRFRCENWLKPSPPNSYTIYFTNYVMIEDY